MSDSTKQVIVVRRDLRMRRGKEIAQGAHAAMAFLTRRITWSGQDGEARLSLSAAEAAWLSSSFRKVTLQVDSEAALLDVHDRAVAAGLVVHLVTDAGLTEFGGVPTRTCLAIGPDYDDKIDPVTGDLKLY